MTDFSEWIKEKRIDSKIVEILAHQDLDDLEDLLECSDEDLAGLDLNPRQKQQLLTALRGESLDSWAEENRITANTVDKLKAAGIDTVGRLRDATNEQLKELGITIGQMKRLQKAIKTPSRPGTSAPSVDGANVNAHKPKKHDKSNETLSKGLNEEFRIVLIGKTGVGKSATGNTLLGKKILSSKMSAKSVTSKCKLEKAERKGKKILVVDTPGLFDTGLSNDEVSKEIIKCVGISSPGPHAIVLVCHIGRFTEEEQKTVQYFIDKFGATVLKYMIVVFTRKDDLTKNRQTVEEYMKEVPVELTNLLDKCGNRYVFFNNDATGTESQQQVEEFLDKVKAMVAKNGGSAYTNEIYKEAEQELQRKMVEHKKQLEGKQEKERIEIEEQMKKKFEKELEEGKIEKRELEKKMKQEQDILQQKLKEEYESKMSDESLRNHERKEIEKDGNFIRFLKASGSAVKTVFTPWTWFKE